MMKTTMTMTTAQEFEVFFRDTEPRLRRAFTGRLAPAQVPDAVAAALEYAWSNWPQVAAMEFPAAYLFRVGLSKSRRRKEGHIAPPSPPEQGLVEPALVDALRRLPRRQREAVWLVEACQWTPTEAAQALGMSLSAVRTHRTRGLQRLRHEIGVETHA